ncbi:hypothetical protein WH50_04550 [Pokkaliibacter plantistimulans]|uniref:Glycosyltransferase family 1 protein n=1 Tax=Pokkaliibacter plantistimulans TaxID=1635171 RepID=A0ABX5M0C2_9GAMM|nr:hypothetical protein [Pokkaliibacter plantistimulans]PXF32367.1 hypothetical protein WH50_04550 [Pokkaliibacter plantistimulans]
MKGIYISGTHQYGAADAFMTALMDELGLLGVVLEVIPFDDLATSYSRYQDEKIDFVLSVNGIGVKVPVSARGSLASSLNCLHISYYLDHPLHHLARFFQAPNHLALCVDLDHCDFVTMVGGRARFFPHGGSATVDPGNIDQLKSIIADKTIDVLYPVSYFDYAKQLQPIRTAAAFMADAIERGEVTTLRDCLVRLKVMAPKGQPATPLTSQLLAALRQMDLCIRARNREREIKAFTAAGIRLTLVGRHVDHYAHLGDHDYLGEVSFTEALALMKKSHWVLHNSPGFEHGLHERITYPLMNGTRVITRYNSYLDDHLGSLSSLAFYRTSYELSPIIAAGHNYDVQKLAGDMAEATKKLSWKTRAMSFKGIIGELCTAASAK